MTKLLLSAALLALTAGAALAADLPPGKEPPLPPPPSPLRWTGFYAGVNAGFGFGTNSSSQTSALGLPVSFQGDAPTGVSGATTLGSGLALSGNGPMTQSGFIGGGQVGYNYQWGANFVVGLEADIQGAGIRGSSASRGLGSDSVMFNTAFPDAYFNSTSVGQTAIRAGLDWLGTVRGHLGYLWTPTMLVYGTGGLSYGGAWATVDQTATSTTLEGTVFGFTHTFMGNSTRSTTLVGWNVGWWRPRVDVHAELVGQGRRHLLEFG